MTEPLIIGIDPGKTGAIALAAGPYGLIVHDMPDAKGAALGALLRDIFASQTVRPSVAWVEQVAARPGAGVSGMFNFGCNYGVILGVLGAWDIPVRHVTPSKWKGALGLSKDKNASRQLAVETWPHASEWFARAKDDGRAEAALIALYGQRQGGAS